ncbi:Uncharacterised protein [Vibrio cholerae]|nr:Uncharacterised protein [Vibrio cholerae]
MSDNCASISLTTWFNLSSFSSNCVNFLRIGAVSLRKSASRRFCSFFAAALFALFAVLVGWVSLRSAFC